MLAVPEAMKAFYRHSQLSIPFFNLPKTGDGKSSDAAPSPFYDLLFEAYEVVNYD